MFRKLTALFLAAAVLTAAPLWGKSDLGEKSVSGIGNFAVAEHHTYFAGEGGVWVHNECTKLKEMIIAKHDGIQSGYKRQGMADDVAYNRAQTDALYEFRSGDYSKWDDWQRTQTGANLFERNPIILRGSPADDVAVANRYLDETGLRVNAVTPKLAKTQQPASIARVGDEIFVASPMKRMPKEWQKFVDDLETVLLQRADDLGWTDEAINAAEIASRHSEALSLMRMRDKLGDLSKFDEINLATAGRHVCGHCVNPTDAAGLAKIAEALGIQRLVVRADVDAVSGKAFQGMSKNATTVVIENGRVLPN